METQTLGQGTSGKRSNWQSITDTTSFEQTFETLFIGFFQRRYPNLNSWRQINETEIQNLMELCINLTPYVIEGRERLNQQLTRTDSQRTRAA